MPGLFNICKTINVINNINIFKGRKHVIISIDAKKDKQNPPCFHDKSPRECSTRENIFQHNKAICEKPVSNIILNGE